MKFTRNLKTTLLGTNINLTLKTKNIDSVYLKSALFFRYRYIDWNATKRFHQFVWIGNWCKYRWDAYLTATLSYSCHSISISSRLLSLPIFKTLVHHFNCIHVFKKKHSSNEIDHIFNKSCGRKSFNNTAWERVSLKLPDSSPNFVPPPLTQNPGSSSGWESKLLFLWVTLKYYCVVM